ncbi:hypothetical protein B0H14DRAFT_34158 [Mycena olivaceomarginata]|nr:hypothetical protein B0H14DRAFT_34158 [Mycena olivaceomarginata]
MPACAQGRSLCAQGRSPLALARALDPSRAHSWRARHLRESAAVALSPCARNCAPVRAELAAHVIDRSCPFYVLPPQRVGARSSSPPSSRAPLDVLRPPRPESRRAVRSACPVWRRAARFFLEGRSLRDCVAATSNFFCLAGRDSCWIFGTQNVLR